ncbi:MAG: T9SS type A sorting domain-containing protein [Chitinophagales bacterium]
MKKKAFLFFLLVSFVVAKSQTFSKRFFFDGVGTQCYAVELRDTFMFVAGVIADTTTNGGIKSVLAKFDYSGNEISKTLLRPTENPSYVATRENSMITTTDGGIVATGYATDTLGKILLSITKYDSQGNIQFYKAIKPNVPGYRTIFGEKLIEYTNKGYYITGGIQLSNYSVKPFLCFTDFNGNLIFFKTYTTNTFYDGVRGITKLPDSNIAISISSSENNPNPWENIGYSRLFKIDTTGLLLHAYTFYDSNTYTQYNLSLTPDSNYLICGKYFGLRHQGQGYKMQCCIVKWDTSFNPLWSYKSGSFYDINSYTDFEQANNEDIILCGQEGCDSTCGWGLVGRITKIDKNSNQIWDRHYKGFTSQSIPYDEQNNLYDIDLMPNGDIIAVGTCQHQTIGQMGWLLHLNADGCMDDGTCGYTEIKEHAQPQNTESIRVFPNPSNGIFTIYANADLPPAACITVFDINGKQLLRQPFFNQANLLNLHHLPNGIYLYEIGNGLVKTYSGKLAIEK